MDRMRSVEIQARSVDEAVRLALEQLDRTADQVDVEILADAQDEFDGEALVRVTAKDGVARRVGPSGQAERPSQETEQITKRVVGELLQAMGYHCDLVAVDNPSAIEGGPDEPPTVFIDILGRDLGMLIGRRGENLSQIQYMANLLVNKELSTWTRVILDVEGYRMRREESLVGLAQRVARQVARTRRPISLEPMPPSERRVVHLALRGDPTVTTQSSGEGALRRVTIYPHR
jgi:spoIIIJ-associated protein